MKTIPLHQPFKLHITLHEMPVPVYRVVLVPEDINMLQLHFVIQVAMGWTNSHLFQFQDRQDRPSIEAKIPSEYDEEDFFTFSPKPERKNADKALLKQDFYADRNGKPFWYWYDFGDDWWHKISFQKPTKKELEEYTGTPVCMEASGACPPEDCGGTWGYENFLAVVLNKKHPEYREMCEWAGLSLKEKFDPTFADMDAINEVLASLPDMDEWSLNSENYYNE